METTRYFDDESVLDSRCSVHMTPKRDWILGFKENYEGMVIMGNILECKVLGITLVN